MDDPATRPSAIPSSKPRDRGVLLQMSGLEAGRLFGVSGPICTLGRGRTCSVRFDDASLSRVHAGIVREGPQYVLEDCSLNGTFVNDQRVRRAILSDGDRIRLGSGASLRFQVVDEDEERTMARVYASSVFDGLTGVYNRKQLEERLSAEVAYAVRHQTELSIVMVDLDHFKSINDSLGHLAGDAVLKSAAALLASAVRTEDVVARYGGEEFVVIARGIPLANAAQLAERLRGGVERSVVGFEGHVIQITASFGVASLTCCAAVGKSVATLLTAADARLYRAKREGRNRIVAG